MMFKFIVQGQSVNGTVLNPPTRIETDSVIKREKALYLKSQDGSGKPYLLFENQKIQVVSVSGQKTKGHLLIHDSLHLAINHKIISIDSISLLKIPKTSFRAIGGGIASVFTLLFVVNTAVSGTPLFITLPFVGVCYMVLTSKKAFKLGTKYKLKVLEGNSKFTP
jgi:hypothetical protein